MSSGIILPSHRRGIFFGDLLDPPFELAGIFPVAVGAGTVSYTHLDVYKRQPMYSHC